METATTNQIEHIKEMLRNLSEERVRDVVDFIGYLIEKERKHKAFVERVLKAEQETTTTYESVEDFMQAIQKEMDELEN